VVRSIWERILAFKWELPVGASYVHCIYCLSILRLRTCHDCTHQAALLLHCRHQGCARPGFPGVYARVSTGFPWIQGQACIQANVAPDDFCEGASIPLELSLEVDLLLDDPAISSHLTWGLYAIDTATTLFETESEEDVDSMTETTNTANTLALERSARPEEEEEEEEDDGNDDEPGGFQTQQEAQDELEPGQKKYTWDDIAPGKYLFQLRNSLGTGLGNNTENHFWINQGGRKRILTVPHGFGGYFDLYFNVTEAHSYTEIREQYHADAPISTPTPMVEIMLDVMYDAATAKDISWELRNLNANEVLGEISSGSIKKASYETYFYNVDQRGDTYQITVRNRSGQGLGQGYISVWVGNIMVWKSDQLSSPSIPPGDNSAPPVPFEIFETFQV